MAILGFDLQKGEFHFCLLEATIHTYTYTKKALAHPGDKFTACDERALIPKTGPFIIGVFRGNFPAGEKERKHDGIEVFGRPEGVHFEAGR